MDCGPVKECAEGTSPPWAYYYGWERLLKLGSQGIIVSDFFSKCPSNMSSRHPCHCGDSADFEKTGLKYTVFDELTGGRGW